MLNFFEFLADSDKLADTIKAASARIEPYIHDNTPVLSSQTINRLVGKEIFFKCENFQKTGSFKARGAVCAGLHALQNNLDFGATVNEKIQLLITHSSGNHGQAIAYTAARMGLKSIIVMPDNSSKPKIDAAQAYGAKIIFCPPTMQDRENTTAQLLNQNSEAVFIHPYQNPYVILGQSTIVYSLRHHFTQPSQLDDALILTPLGGGGMLSGAALACQAGFCGQVAGVEPEQAAEAQKALQTGYIEQPTTLPNTIADGLKATIGQINLDIIAQTNTPIYTVSEKSIAKAMFLIWQHLKIVAEPSCATPLAALLENKINLDNYKKIVLVVSGGNIDFNKIKEYVEISS